MQEEIWKDIPWYEWLYQASNLWRIKSLDRYIKAWKSFWLHFYKWKILKEWKDKDWYINVSLCSKTYRVSRLVAKTFLWLDINNSKIFVCHKDDNVKNNNVDNLFLWNHQDNMDDRNNKNRQNKRIKFNHPML